MSLSTIRSLMLATAFALAGCGGEGGYGLASTPPPPVTPTQTPTPTPTPPPAIIPATVSQQFTVVGSSHPFDGVSTPTFDGSEQLQVRYVQSSNSYEVQLPHSATWGRIAYLPIDGSPADPINYGGGGAHLWLGAGYQYSRIFEWSGGGGLHGFEAIGIATTAGSVPVTGTATYSGELLGGTTESFGGDTWDVRGTIGLSFNFGLGTLSGTIDPTAFVYSLGHLNFRDTVYATGSTSFSGKFDTNLTGVNSFGGLFTGPNAQELIGNFAFPYKSPIDGQTYQADGAFVGAK